MTDTIAEIRARHEYMQDMYGDTALCPSGHADRAALLARVAELEGALRPFAELAEVKLCGSWKDGESIQRTDLAYHIKFGTLRRAAQTLKDTP